MLLSLCESYACIHDMLVDAVTIMKRHVLEAAPASLCTVQHHLGIATASTGVCTSLLPQCDARGQVVRTAAALASA